MLKTAILFAAAFAPAGAAWAQSTEATRYTNNQGVEMIQNRPPPVPAPAVPVTSQGIVQGREAAGPSPTAPPVVQGRTAGEVPAVRDARFRVSAQDQKARDQDRVEILRQELTKELGDYEAKNKVLRNPDMKASLSDDQLSRLQETLQAHERNILDLNAEIIRTTRQ